VEAAFREKSVSGYGPGDRLQGGIDGAKHGADKAQVPKSDVRAAAIAANDEVLVTNGRTNDDEMAGPFTSLCLGLSSVAITGPMLVTIRRTTTGAMTGALLVAQADECRWADAGTAVGAVCVVETEALAIGLSGTDSPAEIRGVWRERRTGIAGSDRVPVD
jgi:hypothetical protein